MENKIIFTLVLCIGLLLLAGCTTTDSIDPADITVTGAIKDLETGNKLEGVTVEVGDKSTTTDSNGQFAITGLEGGYTRDGYLFYFSKQGYKTLTIPVAPNLSGDDTTYDLGTLNLEPK